MEDSLAVAVVVAVVVAGKTRHASRAIVFRGDELLIMHRNKRGRKYRTLIGGGIEVGETPEQAVIRETAEETSIIVDNPKKIFIENVPEFNVIQHVFLCQYVSGYPALHKDSEEYVDTLKGYNVYRPMWLDLNQLLAQSDRFPFVTPRLLEEIVLGHKNNFAYPVKEWTV